MAVSCLAVGQSPYASLQIPKQIQYQGRVSTAAGGAWGGAEGYFTFALVQGTTVLWNNWEGTASPSDPGTVALGAGQVLTLPVTSGTFSIRLGEGSDINEQIPATVFFDSTSNSIRAGVKLAVWFSPDGGSFTRLSPNVEFTSVPYAMVSGIAETVKERAVTTAMLADHSVTSVQIASNAIGNADIGDGQVTGNKLAAGTIPLSKVDGSFMQSLVPAGTILSFGGTAAPAGYLMCAGQSYPNATYPALSSVLGNAFGGDASTFRVPDLRGRFLRGTDDPDGAGSVFAAAGRDPNVSNTDRLAMNSGGNTGNAVGSVQLDELKSHVHNIQLGGDGFTAGGKPQRSANHNDNAVTDVTGGSETRPKNAYVNYIIKY